MSDAVQRVADDAPALNQRLDRAALAQTFLKSGRAHIANVLTADSAQRLHRALAEQVRWTLIHNIGGARVDVPYANEQERSKYAFAAWQQAYSSFTYMYDNHRLSHNGEAYPDARHHLAKLVAFLNGASFLQLTRDVTGFDSIAFADAQATLYRRGDFLTLHDDTADGKNRLAAYVLNLTPFWRTDWGGMLEFVDSEGHVTAGYAPAFNALNVFRVPQRHLVSQVALYGGLRYSVTGWLRAL